MSFLIAGDWLTRHARDRVFEYGADEALRFLLTSIDGLDAALAGDILAGRKRVAGDSRAGIDVVADDAPEGLVEREELAARYRWHFAGVWYDRSTKKYRRPYAVVTGWGQRDMAPNRVPNVNHPKPSAGFVTKYAGGCMEEWALFRCVHYMDDVVGDLAVKMQVPGRPAGEEMVLWGEVPSPPVWVAIARDPHRALAAWLAEFDSLQERGAHIEAARERAALISDDPPRKEPEPPRPPKGGAAPAPSADLIRSLIPPETPEHVREALMRVHTDDSEPTTKRVTDPQDAAYAWVARDGAFWTCRGYMDHAAVAPVIARQLGMDLSRWKDNAEHALGEMGWAKVGRDDENQLAFWLDATKTASNPQFEAVTRWLIAHGGDPLVIQAWADRQRRPD